MCPFTDTTTTHRPHVAASREDLRLRLEQERQTSEQHSSTRRQLFEKTLALFIAISKQGCPAPRYEATHYTEEEKTRREEWIRQKETAQRGHSDTNALTCEGRILFRKDNEGAAFAW